MGRNPEDKEQVSRQGFYPNPEYDLPKALRRIMDLEGCLVYVRNFLPLSLKQHAENVLWPPDEQQRQPDQ